MSFVSVERGSGMWAYGWRLRCRGDREAGALCRNHYTVSFHRSNFVHVQACAILWVKSRHIEMKLKRNSFRTVSVSFQCADSFTPTTKELTIKTKLGLLVASGDEIKPKSYYVRDSQNRLFLCNFFLFFLGCRSLILVCKHTT